MSPSVKLGLLTLVSAAAAVPHYGGYHSRYHKPSGGYGTGKPSSVPYPTGGLGYNSTALPQETSSVIVDEKTTTFLETIYSTQTLVKTVYATRSKSSEGYGSVVPENAPSEAPACGPATVYVTATNQVTVTVQAPSAPPSSVDEPVPSSSSTLVPDYEVPSSSIVFELPSTSIVVPHEPETSALPESPLPIPSSSSTVVYTTTEAPAPPPAPTPTPEPSSSAAAESVIVIPSSSAAPIPSSPPSAPGGKRGLAYNDAALCQAFGDNGKFSWAYNWAATGGNLPEGIKYVPMMHRPSESTVENWLKNVEKAVQGGTDVVMGFNEPDHAAQANLSPEAACSAWEDYMNPIASSHPGVTILGPSVTNGGGSMGLTWLDNFNKVCGSRAKWHATNIHFYDIYEGSVERFKLQVEKAAKMFGKPVWVTEFGLNPGSATDAQAADFLQQVMEYMDGSDKVHGYSYFMVGTGQYQLNSGNGLSAIGQVYNS